MISKSTRLFGLIHDDPNDVWIPKLYNYVLGYNGLDAAYLSFLARADTFTRIVEGISRNGTTEWVHVTEALSSRASAFARSGTAKVDRLDFGPDGVRATHSGLAGDLVGVSERARRELSAAFGTELEWPSDVARAVSEPSYRPCKLTHDDFGVRRDR
ncbi:MAG: hypothetical protein HY791_24360 [Deltaproteobacteria bacterium]|nr:hypothetical protein [Deltaproteobacteria bacterium]